MWYQWTYLATEVDEADLAIPDLLLFSCGFFFAQGDVWTDGKHGFPTAAVFTPEASF